MSGLAGSTSGKQGGGRWERATGGGAAVLLLLLAACTRSAPVAAEALSSLPHARSAGTLDVMLAPIEVAPSALSGPTGTASWEWGPAPVDAGALRETLRLGVQRSGAFRTVTFPPELAHLEMPGLAGETLAHPPGPLGKDVLDVAFERNADVVLRFRVERHRARWVEHHWIHWFNLLVAFGGTGWADWLVPDEIYRAELSVAAEAWSPGTRSLVWGPVTYTAAPEEDLFHWDRGVMTVGILTVPDGLDIPILGHVGALDAESFRHVGALLLPYARNEVARRLAADLVRESDARRGLFANGVLMKTLAVCMGAGHYPLHRKVPDVPYARDDARDWRRILEESGVPRANIACLTEAEPAAPDSATRAAFLKAIRWCARRARPGDTLELYFSGHGFEAGGGLYLVPDDFDPSSPLATSVSLGEVGRALEGVAATTVLILDTSFAGEAGALPRTVRTLASPFAPPESSGAARAVESALERFARKGPGGRVVIVATPPGEAAQNSGEEKEGGLFTALMKESIRSARDKGKRGWLNAEELLSVARTLSDRGQAKRPGLYPLDADPRKILVLPPGRTRG